MSLTQQLTSLEFSILKVLIYFDLFDHPLRPVEIALFIDQDAEIIDIDAALEHLLEHSSVDQIDGYWGLSLVPEKIRLRELKNRIAMKRTSTVEIYSKIVATFPFVKAVFLTGSFSKGVMSEDSDIDFFIVSDPDKLWATKALMVLFRKIFLFDSHRNFCINYLVTSDNLVIHDRNIFTAIELVTMIPVFGHAMYDAIMLGNKWVFEFFPNYKRPKTSKMDVTVEPNHFIKRILEIMFDNKWAARMGEHFMRLSQKKYRSKYHKGLTEAEFNKAIIVSPKVSKVHPHFFQKQVVEKYQKQCDELFTAYSIIAGHDG